MVDPLFAGTVCGAARLALPVPIDSLFDYAVPETIDRAARPGCRVVVRFSGRSLTGLIVERPPLEDVEFARLSVIERVVDSEPVISSRMIQILREAADRVLCPVGLALSTALPRGSAPRWKTVLEPTPRGLEALRRGILAETDAELLQTLARGKAPKGRDLEPRLRQLASDGLLARQAREHAPSARVATETFIRLAPEIDVPETCRDALARAPKQAALLRFIERAGGEVGSGTLRSEFSNTANLLRELSKRGLIESETRDAPRNVLGEPVERDTPLQLSRDQQVALEPICESVRKHEAARYLLHGVTGSGKTEIYLRAISEALQQGRQALVLVPEITLTHQLVHRLRARFGDSLAVLHSGLRPGERLEQWQRLRRGDTPIAVGARSALFAPLEHLGILVIDEEHDSAYKNDEGFRYHASSLAMRLGEAHSCPLVLGSATPSLESSHAADQGEIHRLVLPRRIGDRPLPSVELIDLAAEREKAPRGRKLILTHPLRRAISQTLENGGQTILFLNRRGFSTQIFCFDCGHAEHCPNCEIALVFHAREHNLRCHYCDHTQTPSDECRSCGAPDTALLGMGTERLEEEVRIAFPRARTARLDRDTAHRRGHTEKTLRGLHNHEIDILIGTQMVAKGHDFPGVQLVGVVLADVGLHHPDFRAAERTFQLLTQVAGRAGRAQTPGRVLIQTYAPQHYAIQSARGHDYDSFYAREMKERAGLFYPPFGRIAQLVISHPEEAAANRAANQLGLNLREFVNREAFTELEILGPAPAPLPKLRGRYRFQILVKGLDEDRLLDAARHLLEISQALPKPTQASLDVNPVNML
ncbi:MAG: primosomal protein N' [Myxococcota bacterium]|nr:primosomal protein N' [Myxococcota bacterium]